MADEGVKELVEAIHDLTRVTIALHGKFESKAEAIRKLDEIGLSTSRIANIFGMPSKDVSSTILKAKKSHKDMPKDE